MKVLIIDNYDSFTYNLYQYTGEILGDQDDRFQLDVRRNNEITLAEICSEKYEKIILSPGPGNPCDPSYTGICIQLIRELSPQIEILGVCLGMQIIAYAFGGSIVPTIPMHGKTSMIRTDSKGIFSGIPSEFCVMRYHSLAVASETLPECFEISAQIIDVNQQEIMGIRHKTYPIEGVQFHPESFATEAGKQIIVNFLCQDKKHI